MENIQVSFFVLVFAVTGHVKVCSGLEDLTKSDSQDLFGADSASYQIQNKNSNCYFPENWTVLIRHFLMACLCCMWQIEKPSLVSMECHQVMLSSCHSLRCFLYCFCLSGIFTASLISSYLLVTQLAS